MPARKKYTAKQKAAYARRMRAKKKITKKHAYRKSYQIAKITAPLMPKTRLCFMNYVQRFRLDPPAVNAAITDTSNSTMAIRTFTINNLKDIDEMTSGITGAGVMNDTFTNHQPRGYTEWGTHYNNMTVVSTKTTIEGRNRYVNVGHTDGNYVKRPEPVALGFMTSHFNKKAHASVAGVKFNDLLEQKQCVYRELNDDRHKVKLTNTWQLKKEASRNKNLNVNVPTSDFAWGSLYEVDIAASNKRYCHIFVAPLGIKDNTDPTPIDVTVQISLCVLLSNRNEMTRS